MKMSDSEIKDMLRNTRKSMAAELLQQLILLKKNRYIFDSVDRIYGDYEAMNNPTSNKPQAEDEEGGGGGGIGGGDMDGWNLGRLLKKVI